MNAMFVTRLRVLARIALVLAMSAGSLRLCGGLMAEPTPKGTATAGTAALEDEESPRSAPVATPQDRYTALARAFSEIEKKSTQAILEAKTREEKLHHLPPDDPLASLRDRPMWREALRTHELPRVEFGERFLALAREYPRDPVAVDCLLWINSHALASPRYYEIQSQILDLIARNQLDSEKMASVLPWWCFGLGCDGLADGERFLRIVLEKSRRRESRGIAALSLGYCLKRESEIVEGLRAGLEFGENTSVDLVAGQSADRIKELKAMDPEKIGREAEQVLHLAENQYGDVPWKNHRMTIGEGARQLLHEIAHLGLGKEAPEIDGEDLDGQKLRLCDFRGKVVVLSFWASWCGPCMRLVPHERAMVKHFAGKPFVLLGINGDTTRQAAKNSAAKNEISWRSWWDGNHGEGPIAKQWNVMAWPAIYILDKHGVIRRRPAVSGQWDAIEKAVEKLLDHAN